MIRILRRLIMSDVDKRVRASNSLNKLKRIKKKSDSWFKSALKEELAERISEYRPRIDISRTLNNEQRGKRLLSVLDEVKSLQKNNQSLKLSYEVIELWIMSLISDEPIYKARVDELINYMEKRN